MKNLFPSKPMFDLTLLFSTLLLSFLCCNCNECPSNIKIIETNLDAPIPEEDAEKAVIYLQSNQSSQTALLTTGSLFWRSEDQGRTWKNITNSLPGSNRFRSINLAPDHKTVIVLGFDKYLWNSFDYGVTFHQVEGPGLFSDIKFHPLNPEWVIGIVCPVNMQFCSGNLYLSQDSGSNWANIRNNVKDVDWQAASDDEKMLVTWEGTNLVKSKTFFRTDPTILATGVAGYKSINNKIFIATGTEKGFLLSVSQNFGETFKAVRFPSNLAEHRFTLLDTTEGFTFINVQHENLDFTWGNVYSSNAFDTDFSLSLERNVRSWTGKCDFKALAGIEGIYLANRFASISTGKYTVISYDKGSKWKRLPTPSGVSCTPKEADDCSLNLVGTSDSGIWFTRKEATGLILALGSVSQYLINKDPEVGLFMSRDAGWTWKFIASGRYTYEIGNSGSLILAFTNNKATDTMKYSLNEGESWSDCKFTDNPIEIKDIVSDPEMRSGLFIVIGRRGDKGVLVSIDFTETFPRLCGGTQAPSDPKSDYEYWQPSDTKGNECLLGRRIQYLRRKITSNCLNPPSYSTITFQVVKNCSCTEENYECDFCFNEVSNQCVPDTISPACVDYDPKKIPDPCVGVYYESRGYRRVPGDTCDSASGVDHLPIRRTCPGPPKIPDTGTSQTGKPTLLLTFFALVFIITALGGVWWYSGQNETLRSFLKRFIPEEYLPEITVEHVDYSKVVIGDEELEEDAAEINIEDSKVDN